MDEITNQVIIQSEVLQLPKEGWALLVSIHGFENEERAEQLRHVLHKQMQTLVDLSTAQQH